MVSFPCLLFQRNKEESALSQIKEVTGIDDIKVITKAIRACCNKDGKYNIEDVVTMLVQDSSEYNVIISALQISI